LWFSGRFCGLRQLHPQQAHLFPQLAHFASEFHHCIATSFVLSDG
jgi:hypothetical protein